MAKILVIEDDPTVQALIVKLLKAEGFEVISGSDGLTGVQLAQIHEPDLIVCDIMMPEFNGYEVLDQLRQDPATARIPFIFLSAKADRTDLRQGMELGADDYLTKPFKRAELLGAISARLEKRASVTQPYIDEMKRAAQSLSQIAYCDPLTSLPNRIMLHHKLQEAVRQAQRSQQWVAVICLNLDRFQSINTNLGYSSGDLLLQLVAERLQAAFSNQSTIARLGGDEFSLLLTNVTSQQDIVAVSQQILSVLSEPYNLNGHYARIQVSIGIAVYPKNSENPDRLLNQADIAMRYAKAQGNGKYAFYDTEMDLLSIERQLLESSLNQALENSEFQLLYQPQINLVTGRIIGAEALLRWQHSELGLVQPSKFIPIAEETGLIIPIGEWVLRTACKQAKLWQTPSRSPVQVSVNLSARQFKQLDLIDMVAQVLEETELDSNMLVIELTETSVMENVEATITTLKELKAMGVQISIDDFGTGYSSLNYLKRFPIDALKIDRSFVQEITTDANDAAISKAIIAMAQSLQLKVIAEGVETQEQFAFLRQSGCHAMQGYLFSRPVAVEEFGQFLKDDRRLS